MSSNDHLQVIVATKLIHSFLLCLAVMNCGFCFLLAAELYASQLKFATSDAAVVLQAVANSCQAESCTTSASCGINSPVFY